VQVTAQNDPQSIFIAGGLTSNFYKLN